MFSFGMSRALRANAPLCLLAEIDHPDGMFRCWTGIGELDYAGVKWTGIGNLGRVGPARQTVELQIQDVNFVLSGCDPETVALLSNSVRNRPAKLWLACLDEKERIVPDPYEMIDALMDYQTFTATEEGECLVTIMARSGFYTLERAINDCWTDEDQKKRFPDDTGLAYIGELQNQEVKWTPN